MLKRFAVLVVVLLAIGAGSSTSSASAAPQSSRLAWIGEPTEPDDYGDPDELDPGSTRTDPTEPSERLIAGEPTEPSEGLLKTVLGQVAYLLLALCR
jgi:hypothetical protein